MAPISPPTWMQAGSYSARADRLLLASLLSYPGFAADEATPLRIRQGVKPSYTQYQMKVRAAATPNMTVIVSAGFCWIDNHDLAGYGAYACVNDADYTVTVPAAGGAGQFRKDCIVASVYDAETAGAASEFRIELIQGPYAASAGATVRGTLPPNAQVLADIAVAPSQTSVSSGNITDIRQYAVAAGGIVPVASSAAPTRPHPGQVLYYTDTDAFYVGQQAGTVRQVREVVRPSSSDQVSLPASPVTGAVTDFTSGQWPPVTVTVPPSGQVRITIGAALVNSNTAGSTAWVLWRASGALTEGGSSKNAVSVAGTRCYASRTVTRSGLTPGASLTVTPQYQFSSLGSIPTVTNCADGQLVVEPVA
ncbi:hypothetical protein ACFZB4_18590 [Streptomyces pseudovenezuelae]|uniref:hypothetical protein n=1 Tax=Streptomyces pseudovenezuelae TaxID=67350 RepID=UPI0036E5986E